MMRYLMVVSFAVALTLAVSGCQTETMEGFGRDVQKVGQEIED
jgi:predicted small secreted protein